MPRDLVFKRAVLVNPVKKQTLLIVEASEVSTEKPSV